MRHPGRPRVCAVGEAVEIAPRDPDPSADYGWSIARAPAGSTAAVDPDAAVQWFEPDRPGRYRLRLRTPETTHELTVRAFDEGLSPDGDEATGPPAYSGDAGDDHDALAGKVAGDDPDGTGASGGSGLPTDAGGDPEGAADRPRVHLETAVTDEAVVIEADVRPRGRSAGRDADRAGDADGATAAAPRVEFLIDDRDDLSTAAATVDGRTLTIPRERLGARARVYAVPVTDDAYGVTDAVDVRRARAGGDARDGDSDLDGDSNRNGDSDRNAGSDLDGDRNADADGDAFEVDRPFDPPSWALDTRIYEVYVRTFDDSEAAGSHLDAVRERLGELEELGVDTLWLTPVLEHDGAPHGYNITDFFSVAADLGGREAYEALVDAAHDRGMRVLFDLVCNHSAREHPFFEDAYGNPDSPYRSWYEWDEGGEPGTYFDWERIANFDFSSLAVRRHLLDAVDEWAPLVDGFRCDMAWAVPNGFWTEVHDRVKARDAEFLLLDETIPYIPDFQAGLFDMHFDSTTAFALREVGDGNRAAEGVLEAVEERRRVGFPEHASFMLYHENHDEPRYLASYGDAAALAAAGALATLPGAPMVYAGQELGQLGRRDRIDRSAPREDLREHYRRLLALRDERPALAHRAALSRVEYAVRDGDPRSVVAFRREAVAEGDGSDDDGRSGDAVVVVLNFAEETARVRVDAPATATDLVTGERVAADGPGSGTEPAAGDEASAAAAGDDGDGDDDGAGVAVAVDDVVVLPVRR
ncbi:DUF3459 domain-containing protein [Halobaculum sp. CBA1158]|uniref:alpha-amylase MalA n=1 Tax=Halobaculum sp. CBA1158 TaxID=2904243 RepID=UPI001F199D39|nr:alpha-amylase MalA [Halobaculum sp. CBA1158]UIO99053.1 DUF3459 domain-containing protein [Halobaculum sp. CBA1158]